MSSALPTPIRAESREADNLPADWDLVTLADVGRVYSGGTPNRTRPSYWGPPIPWVTTAEVDGGEIRSTKQQITEAGLASSAATVAPPGTILIAMYGQGKTRGKAAILGIPAAMNQACAVVELREASPKFVLHYLVASYERIRAISNAGGQENLSGELVKTIPVPLPPPEEQAQIARVLDDVDDFIRSLERLIVKKQNLKRGLMQELLTGQSRLPGFEDSWCTHTFGEVATPSRVRADPRAVAEDTPLVELDHVVSAEGRLSAFARAGDAVSLKAVFEPGDVLFGKLRSYLRKYWLADRAGLCSTEIWVLRAVGPVESPYVRYMVESGRFIELASGGYGTHMPRADWRTLSRLEFVVPPPAEQRAIARVLADADICIDVLRKRLDKALDIKTAMMQQLLTGQIRLPVAEAVS